MSRQISALITLLALASASLSNPFRPTPAAHAQRPSPGGPTRQSSCDQGPGSPSTDRAFDLDQIAADWGVFCEPSPIDGGYATWRKQNIASPSIDGEALECGLTGGSHYSNIHCYRNLAPSPSTVAITLTASFMVLPGPTCADFETACVQALEFSASKWQGQLRYEWALQWQNIGGPCPQWRYWDPTQRERWVPLAPPQPPTPRAGRWYTLRLAGEIWQGQVRYIWFELAELLAPANRYFFGPLDVPPAYSTDDLSLLAVAIQLDGNDQQDPYSAVLDQIALEQAGQPSFLGLPPRLYLPLQLSQATTPGNGCT